jgi:signal transduction histidine kinase
VTLPRISLRSLLIAINLFILLLPLAGIQLMRLYESALVRQTESALIAQGAFISAFYRSIWVEMREGSTLGLEFMPGDWRPHAPTLDLAESDILAPFPDGTINAQAESDARMVGERLIPVLKDAQLVTLAGIRIVDRNGVIVASTGEDVGQNISAGEEVALALQGQTVSRLRHKNDQNESRPLDSISRTSRVRVFVASPVFAGGEIAGAVMLSRTPPSILQALYAKRWLLLQALGLILGLVLIMSLVTHRMIARPIRRLAEQAAAVAAGTELSSGNNEVVQARTTEVARLQQAIEEMATTLQARASYLSEFARHISHEFKTPLAGISGSVELLKDHAREMDPVTRDRFLTNIEQAASRLNRLTQRLLELTQAEMAASLSRDVHLDELVSELSRNLKQVNVELSPAARSSVVRTTPDALLAVLEILAENAEAHGASCVKVDVAECERESQCCVVIHFSDNGCGISPGNRDRVFEPFFTTQREQGGTGLGLAIAEALLSPCGGRLELGETRDTGAEFLITIPGRL